jgi:hypothetical protein
MRERITQPHESSVGAGQSRPPVRNAESSRRSEANRLHRNRIGLAASILFWSMLITAVAMIVQLSFYQFLSGAAPRSFHMFISRSTLATKSLAMIGLLCGVCLLTMRQRSTLLKTLTWLMRAAAAALVICTLWQWRGYLSTTRWSSAPLQNIQTFALVTLFSAMIIYCGRNWRELFPERFIETVQLMSLLLLLVLVTLTIGTAWRGIGSRSWVWLPFPTIAEMAHSFLLIGGAVMAFRIRNVARRINQEGKCPMCLYNLQGNPQRGCPECGWQRTTPGQ